VLYSCTTEAEGVFRFQEVPTGELTVGCYVEGYAIQDLLGVTVSDEWVRFQLSPERVVACGRVLNAEGQPIAGAWIERWCSIPHPGGDSPIKCVAGVESNANGEFALTDLDQAGNLGIRVYPFGHPRGSARGEPWLRSTIRSQIESRLPPELEVIHVPHAVPLAVRIVDADGEAVENVRVTVRFSQPGPEGAMCGDSLVTEADGVAAFRCVWAGERRITAAQGQRRQAFSLTVPSDRNLPLMTLPMFGRGRIEGQMISQWGIPEVGEDVIVYQVHSVPGQFGSTHRSCDRVTTDEEGRFQVSDLLPGEYRLAVVHPALSAEERGANSAQVILTGNQQVVSLTEPLSADRSVPSVSGVVVDVTGHTVSGTVVSLQTRHFSDWNSECRHMWHRARLGQEGHFLTDSQGRFSGSFERLLSGSRIIWGHSLGRESLVVWAQSDDGRCGVVHIPPNGDWGTERDVTLPLRESTSLRGQLLDSLGNEPLRGFWVGLFFPSATPGTSSSSQENRGSNAHRASQRRGSVRIEENGEFEFGPLPREAAICLEIFNPSFTQCQIVGPHTVPASGEMTIFWQPTELLDNPGRL
jgi:hypothetical protein